MSCVLLIQNQGPLAHIWLAANYDKRLSKQQLLSTNIAQSSQLVSEDQSPQSSITLRVSSQLLLGIVRIYSRKTKYLLDDVSDILAKLKSSFRHATGARLGPESGALVNAAALDTIVSNINSLLLPDAVTAPNLFFQHDLNLDLLSNSFGDLLNNSFDRLIEIPRAASDNLLDQGLGFDDSIDFDLGDLSDGDNSVELGRDAQPLLDRDTSLISIIDKELDSAQPLETIQPHIPEPVRAPVRYRPPPGGAKRKLIVDSERDLSGISIDSLRENQARMLNLTITLSLLELQKLQLIQELALGPAMKRRRLGQLDALLQDHSVRLALQEQENELDTELNESSFDFDLSLSESDEEDTASSRTKSPESESRPLYDDPAQRQKSNAQVASHLCQLVSESNNTTFADLIQADTSAKKPLGSVSENVVSPKKEAARCFFELLVLATDDCVQVSQNQGVDGPIVIGARDRLFTKFT